MKKEQEFVNVHIDVTTKKMFISNKLYPTLQEANKGIFIGYGIEKVGCFEIEYSKLKQKIKK